MSDDPSIEHAPATNIRRLTFALFFCSGLSSLVFEIVWMRLLTVILGNTVLATSTVLTVFMGGLALGSLVAGRLIDRRTDPLRVYGLLEILIGVLGLCLTSLLAQTGPVYVWMHRVLAPFPGWLIPVRYIYCFVLLAVPTTMMGATTPVLSKFIVERESYLGLNIGRLYAVNTLGAAAGCFVAGFVLIGNLGVNLTVGVAAVVSTFVGFVAWYLHKAAARPAVSHSKTPKPTDLPVPQPEEAPRVGSRLRPVILVAFALAGFAGLGYEVVWTRILIFFLGNTVYAFSTMLTTFLIGMAIGSLVVAFFVDRARRLLTLFGLIEAAIGFYVLLTIYGFSWGAEAIAPYGDHYPMWEGSLTRFGKAFALILLPTFLAGTTFSIAGRVYTTNFKRLGRSVGELYAWNTIGAILGSAATGFVLMPLVGLQKAMLVLCCINLAMGAVLCAMEPAMRRPLRMALAALVAAAAVIGVVAAPPDVFRHMQEVVSPNAEVLFYKEDPFGTVSVKRKGIHRSIYIDNIDVAGSAPLYLDSHKSLGHLPMLLHPNPRNVFVLGFGAGGSSYSVSTYPEVERIDAAEICGGVAEAARLLTQVNHDVFSNPKFHLHINDGRHYLLTADRKYDVISVDLLLASCAGAGSLYTREFYALCFDRLQDDGLMVQWLSPSHIAPTYVEMILRTARSVFPHLSLWFTRHHNHVIMVASKRPLEIDYAAIATRMGRPDTERDLAEVRLNDPAVFLSYFIAAGDTLDRALGDIGLMNTDDLPLVEYKLPFYPPKQLTANLESLAQLKSSIQPFLVDITPAERERVHGYEQASRLVLEAIVRDKLGDTAGAIEECRTAAQMKPDYYEAQAWLRYFQDDQRR